MGKYHLFLRGLLLNEEVERCGHLTPLWCLSVACGSSAQREQIRSNLQLGNEQPGVDSWLYSKHTPRHRDKTR